MLSQLISQKIQPYKEEKQRAITIIQNIAASSFRFASLASGALQIYIRAE
jgi:3'-phosphoadenosine 5'-phosphosulfate (PAPS) 3'-phosphatase